MNRLRFLFLLMLFSAPVVASNEVWLFGTKEQKFSNKQRLANSWEIKHYLIDGGVDFESHLSQGLSSDPAVAMKQIKSRFKKNKHLWEQQAKRSWQSAVNAQSLNIDKFPAITFDRGKTVIYGVTSLIKALKIHKRSNR